MNNITNTLKLLLLGLALVLNINGCGNMSIASEYDPKYNFADLKTYAWIPDPDIDVDSQLEVKRLKAAIDKKMAQMGYQQSEEPNFKIALHMLTGGTTNLAEWGYGYGWQGASGYGVSAYPVGQGSILVDIIDAKTNELVWQGLGSAETQNEDAEIRDRTIRRMLNELFKDFPPKGK